MWGVQIGTVWLGREEGPAENHRKRAVVEDYDCDDNVDDDAHLGVTLGYKDTKRNMDFVGDFKKSRKTTAFGPVFPFVRWAQVK